MIESNQFLDADSWIFFRLNNAPVFTAEEGDFNVFCFMDARSQRILAMEFVKASQTEVSEIELKRLLDQAFDHDALYPEVIMVSVEQHRQFLISQAKTLGIELKELPEPAIAALVKDAREGFAEHFG